MLIMPSMLIPAAKKAKMKIPKLDKDEKYNPEEYLHFHLYCCAQLGRPITWGNHWENAKIIAKIPKDKLKTITFDELNALGFSP